jgi:3-hydroxyacyl-CoA dehydrogenase
MDRLVSLRVEDSIAIATMNNPPVNALSRSLVSELVAALTEFSANPQAKALVLASTGRLFVAGADIREIEAITRGERPPDLSYLNDLLHKIEQSPKPIVMAMQGSALGIGLELAMAGHYRLLHTQAQVGQPEVKLGLIPGAGGTQRLPRLAGWEKALELCVFGEAISAQEALAAGIVDQLCPGDPLPAAREAARNISSPRRTCDLPSPGPDPDLFDQYREEAHAAFPHQAAPIEAILAIQAASRPFAEGLAAEAALFTAQLQHSQARALVHLFFAEREITRFPGLGPETKPAPLDSIQLLPSQPPAANLFLSPGGPGCLFHRFETNVVEIAPTPESTPETLATALALARQQRRLPVYASDPAKLLLDRLASAYGPQRDAESLAHTAQELLDRGHALRASDLDLVCVRALGFPAYLGGPLHWQKHR